jgi:3-oxoacyl-[acyl-carrier protein] reductase
MKDKKVLITGGSDGLGFEIAKKCHALDAKVILLSRGEERLKQSAEQIGCDYIACDITSINDCKAVADKVGALDILVNNAGIWADEKSGTTDLSVIARTIDTNLTGAIYLTELFLPKMKEQGNGTIFFTNSSAGWGYGNDPQARTYSASKWGLRGFAEALEIHLKGTRIKVVTMYPGGMDTNMFEKSGWEKSTARGQSWQGDVEKFANAAVFALNQPDDVNIGVIRVRKP